MPGVVYIPGAEQLGPDTGAAMDTPNLPPRVVWHTVECPTGRGYFQSMASYLKRESVWPQVLLDPETDSLGQFGRLDRSGRALRNDGTTRTNRTGRVCIQIEVLGRAAQPFTAQSTWRPGAKFRALMAAIRSWGIPDRFPMGDPPKYPGGSRRDRAVWLNQAGHYGHANVPGNDHGDPGAIDPAKLWAAAGGSTPMPQPEVPSSTPTPRKKTKMALVSKTVPQVVGDDSATTLTAVPGHCWVNVSADYVPAGERVTVRIDVSDGGGGWIHQGVTRLVGNGVVTALELDRWDVPRVVSVKRQSHPKAVLDVTLHYPEV
ncbi:hypothetical protein [Streptodolium elevatio]|uniref:N-acetylmuramoyl-L-alanine amidase n=1 Tax=Streptodolium elevatio TaxID=3157996 RepID=A0ABV3DLD8_9ACTN